MSSQKYSEIGSQIDSPSSSQRASNLPSDLSSRIVFQNKFIVVIDKPAGVLTTPPRFRENGREVLGLVLQNYLRQQIYPVHRLDFEVSGLVIYALTEGAHRAFSKKFESRAVYKTYQALSAGKALTGEGLYLNQEKGESSNHGQPTNLSEIPTLKRFFWKSNIFRGKKRSFESPAGSPSLTEGIRHLDLEHAELGIVTPWSLFPMTGRPHQLRYEMYKHGFPILNDLLYSGLPVQGWSNQIALRAVSLKFDDQKKLDKDFLEDWSIPAKFEVADKLF